MSMLPVCLLGQQTVAPESKIADQSRIIYEWVRVQQLDQWWHWLAILGVCLLVGSYVILWYRRDSVELFRPVGWAMTLLRMAALVGLLLYFFQLEKRTEQRIVRDSRVAVLVDTSLSMMLPGTPTAVGRSNELSRAEEALRLVGQSEFLQELSKRHQLTVHRFDQAARPPSLAALEKSGVPENSAGQIVPAAPTAASTQDEALRAARYLTWTAIAALSLALLGFTVGWLAQIFGAREWVAGSWVLFLASLLALTGMTVGAFAVVPRTEFSLETLVGIPSANAGPPRVAKPDTESEAPSTSLPADWQSALAPSGSETRLGDAVKWVLDRESSGPLAGIVVLTDGRSNSGVDPRDVLPVAQSARVPLYIIGLGSSESPTNVQLVELDVPKRLYPGDRFTLKALLGASGFDGRRVTLQTLSGPAGTDVEQMSIEDEVEVQLAADGSLSTASFQLNPKAVGEWDYAVRILALDGDTNADDNLKTVRVEVIERKNRVLILAGGPTREYQFVRNLLYRDRDVESHVLLQTGSERTSQEAQELLQEFPATLSELSEYDAVLAFDADWTRIPGASITALERWVAEQAGGLILVAGSVEMPKWTSRSASGVGPQLLRSLSPVILDKRGSSLLAAGRVEGENPWPLELTADGAQSEFLWATDEKESSLRLWEDFEGVYTFYSAYQLKPGARSLLAFSDPSEAVDGQLPIYMASQFYGAGRTLFIGGGELWRIRSQGEQYFDRLYTKMVRWVSQGRLLLDSDRGVLLADREEALLGDQVQLRAVLKDELFEPLVQPEVLARLIDPQGLNTPLVLRPLSDGSQPGVYTGQFPILRPGEYSAQLQLGGLGSDEILSVNIQAKVPALELQRAELDETLLKRLAVESGGQYWTGVEQAVAADAEGVPAIIAAIQPQDQVAYLPGTPDQLFQLRWLGWLMALVAGCLTLEWLTRRLHRLA